MRFRPPASLRRAALLGGLLAPLVLLAGCGPTRDEFAPACPLARPLPQAERLERYRDAAGPAGRDPTDLMLGGQIMAVSGKCKEGKNSHTLDATLTMTMLFHRGPAMPAAGVDVPFFIAVAEGDGILTKQVFSHRIAFPANGDQVQFTTAPVEIDLPVTPQRTGAAYTIWVGFQLSPAELAAQGK